MGVNMDLRDIFESFFYRKKKIDFILQFYIFSMIIILKYL